MVTLHIEHPIVDYATWSAAFARFEPVRRQAGVQHERVQRPIDDPAFIVVDLDFETAQAAEQFVGFLRANVWSNPDNSPGLAGTPVTRILEAVGAAPHG